MKEYLESSTVSAGWYLTVVTTFPGDGQTEGCFFLEVYKSPFNSVHAVKSHSCHGQFRCAFIHF